MMTGMRSYGGTTLISLVLLVVMSVLVSGCSGVGGSAEAETVTLAATLPPAAWPHRDATSTPEPEPTRVPPTVPRVRPTATRVPPTATVDTTTTEQPEPEALAVTIRVPGEAPDSVESDGTPTHFVAENLMDGDPTTAWRIAGDGADVVITLDFTEPLTVTGLEIIPGYAKVDPHDGTDRFVQNRRVALIRIDVDGKVLVDARLEDAPAMQRIALPEPARGEQVILTILETTDHGGRDFTAISELVVVTDDGA